jgi:glyoxylase-like metal-dependent hydrolase (beta-lactamase superfamily II)
MIIATTPLDSRCRLLHYRGVTGNIYLVVDEAQKRTCLVDCGMPSDVPGLLAALSGLPPLDRVICTHFHIDHVSGWHGLKKAFPDLTLWFREPARPWIHGNKRLPPPGLRVLRTLFLPVMREYRYCPRWGEIRATGLYGTGLRPGFPRAGVRFFADDEDPLPGFTTLPTPGHRPDHTAFWNAQSRVLLCGDCLLRVGPHLITDNFLSDSEAHRRSLDRLRQLGKIDLLCPGHGACAPWDPAETFTGGDFQMRLF